MSSSFSRKYKKICMINLFLRYDELGLSPFCEYKIADIKYYCIAEKSSDAGLEAGIPARRYIVQRRTRGAGKQQVVERSAETVGLAG